MTKFDFARDAERAGDLAIAEPVPHLPSRTVLMLMDLAILIAVILAVVVQDLREAAVDAGRYRTITLPQAQSMMATLGCSTSEVHYSEIQRAGARAECLSRPHSSLSVFVDRTDMLYVVSGEPGVSVSRIGPFCMPPEPEPFLVTGPNWYYISFTKEDAARAMELSGAEQQCGPRLE